ncbi:methylated-DNA--[protein]-cysteine S-methyltransferase [Marinobacter sp. X15-166B]|uniref:methylated-DNA--[protein]-cysteine S-methyltransferase n=1 Tax=Marinobacter sp. X15-166B TaxID=1897620 RepID=UPI00085BE0FA|nr:methylated-DNA--[protein]-cysteine S-methyltransferase [Marinobacter sp. X15-166B]OEY67591.1 hypothetical protein BG841_14885 [Marinobacter sp. X15-166B]
MFHTPAPVGFTLANCSLGLMLVAESEKGICGIAFGDDRQHLIDEFKHRFPGAEERVSGSLGQRVARLVQFVDAATDWPDLPLDVRGTEFQQQVWRAISDIPSGATATYTDIAKKIGAPKAVRAVAGACAANHLALAIPCHRVVRRDGGLSGYRWGVERKRVLLAREAQSR